MDAVMTKVPAGWHADPLRDDVLRWWDGNGWTRDTAADDAVAPPRSGFDAVGLPAPDPGAVPDWDMADLEECLRVSALWRDAVTRIRGLSRRSAVLHVIIDRLPPILIDTRYRAYGWRYPLAALPPAPVEVTIEVQASAPLAPEVFALRNGALTQLLDRFEALAEAEAA